MTSERRYRITMGVIAILVIGLVVAGVLSHDHASAAAGCHRKVTHGRPGTLTEREATRKELRGKRGQKHRRSRRRITLAATGPATPINMGGTRGIGVTDIVVNSSPPLPPGIKSRQLTLTVPKRFERSGNNLTSAYLPTPEFSRPKILENGKVVAFRLCVNVSGAQAGSYIGQVIVGGPPRIQPATVAITVNAKDEWLFWVGLAGAVILAFLLLLAQAAKKRHSDNESFGKACGDALGDGWGFWLPTLIAIGASVVAIYQVWDSTIAWGADTGASLIALGGTVLSAAGIGGFLTSIRG